MLAVFLVFGVCFLCVLSKVRIMSWGVAGLGGVRLGSHTRYIQLSWLVLKKREQRNRVTGKLLSLKSPHRIWLDYFNFPSLVCNHPVSISRHEDRHVKNHSVPLTLSRCRNKWSGSNLFLISSLRFPCIERFGRCDFLQLSSHDYRSCCLFQAYLKFGFE